MSVHRRSLAAVVEEDIDIKEKFGLLKPAKTLLSSTLILDFADHW